MLKRYLQRDYFFRRICSRPQRTDIFNLRAKSKEGFKESLSINTAHSADHSVGKRNSYLCVQPLTSIQRVECSSNSYIDSQECEERRMDINGKLSGWNRSNIGMNSILWPRYLFVGLVIKHHANGRKKIWRQLTGLQFECTHAPCTLQAAWWNVV